VPRSEFGHASSDELARKKPSFGERIGVKPIAAVHSIDALAFDLFATTVLSIGTMSLLGQLQTWRQTIIR
jgi:hypothetical protein